MTDIESESIRNHGPLSKITQADIDRHQRIVTCCPNGEDGSRLHDVDDEGEL